MKYGYTEASGWNPETGFGTHLFSKLLSYALEVGVVDFIDSAVDVVS